MTAQDAYDEREGSTFTDWPTMRVEYREASHRYWIHAAGERRDAISVTGALKVLDKPALVRWAEAAGAEGACRLAHDGMLDAVGVDRNGEIVREPIVRPENAVYLVRELGLGADAKRDAGAHRGTVTHGVLEVYHRDETVPNARDFAPEHRGFVAGLCRWLVRAMPTPILIEGVVGSLVHGFAGRVDLVADVKGAVRVCDLKTNPKGRTYDESHLQAAGYWLAAEECGVAADMAPPLIVAVGEDGTFEEVGCDATPADFLSVLDTSRRVARLRRLRQARERALAKGEVVPDAV